jgi:hypothetical protein
VTWANLTWYDLLEYVWHWLLWGWTWMVDA